MAWRRPRTERRVEGCACRSSRLCSASSLTRARGRCGFLRCLPHPSPFVPPPMLLRRSRAVLHRHRPSRAHRQSHRSMSMSGSACAQALRARIPIVGSSCALRPFVCRPAPYRLLSTPRMPRITTGRSASLPRSSMSTHHGGVFCGCLLVEESTERQDTQLSIEDFGRKKNGERC